MSSRNYVALVDDLLRRGHHNETIGILICGTKNDRSVRYSLGRSTSPWPSPHTPMTEFPQTNSRHCPTKGISLQRLNGLNPTRMSKPAREIPDRTWVDRTWNGRKRSRSIGTVSTQPRRSGPSTNRDARYFPGPSGRRNAALCRLLRARELLVPSGCDLRVPRAVARKVRIGLYSDNFSPTCLTSVWVCLNRFRQPRSLNQLVGRVIPVRRMLEVSASRPEDQGAFLE